MTLILLSRFMTLSLVILYIWFILVNLTTKRQELNLTFDSESKNFKELLGPKKKDSTCFTENLNSTQ